MTTGWTFRDTTSRIVELDIITFLMEKIRPNLKEFLKGLTYDSNGVVTVTVNEDRLLEYLRDTIRIRLLYDDYTKLCERIRTQIVRQYLDWSKPIDNAGTYEYIDTNYDAYYACFK